MFLSNQIGRNKMIGSLLRFVALALAWLCAGLAVLNSDLLLAGVASGLACALLFNVFKCQKI